jgi:hypothetical protein
VKNVQEYRSVETGGQVASMGMRNTYKRLIGKSEGRRRFRRPMRRRRLEDNIKMGLKVTDFGV